MTRQVRLNNDLKSIFSTEYLSTVTLNSDISQGSVATFGRCGGIFNADFIANLLTSQPVKRIMKIGGHLMKLS